MSSALQKRFVYYASLKTDRNDLYEGVRANLSSYINNNEQEKKSKNLEIAHKLERIAQGEARKEVRAIKEYFSNANVPNPLNIDENFIYTEDFGKNLIQLFNIIYQSQSAFERAVTRITSDLDTDNRQISYSRFFEKEFIAQLKSATLNIPEQYWVEKDIKEIIDEEIVEKAMFATLQKMGNSRDLTKGTKDKGFSYILPELKKIRGTAAGNRLVKELFNAMQMDQLLNNIESVESASDLAKQMKVAHGYLQKEVQGNKTKYVSTKTNLSSAQRAGIIQEVLATFLAGIEDKKHGISTTVRTGNLNNIKSDIISTINLNSDLIIQKLQDINRQSNSVRAQNVKKLREINEYLRKMKKGFITYVSAKEYALLDSFGGFSIEDQSLANFYETWKGTNVSELTGAILQLANGPTVLDSSEKRTACESLEKKLAGEVARFLFDDYATIGNEWKEGANTIHLMLLDGVYMPLSFVLHLLARAMEETVKDEYRQLINVHIAVGQEASVKWVNENGKFTPPEGYYANPMGVWKEQRDSAMENIKIQAHLLKNFKQLIKNLKF